MKVAIVTHSRHQEIEASIPRLLRLALALTGQMASAEDLVQEAVSRVWARAADIRGPIYPYLRRVMINQNTDTYRRGRGLTAIPDAVEAAVPERPDPGDRIDMERLLTALSADHRLLIVLRYYADLTFSQIAAHIGRPAGTVRRQCTEALAQIRVLHAQQSALDAQQQSQTPFGSQEERT